MKKKSPSGPKRKVFFGGGIRKEITPEGGKEKKSPKRFEEKKIASEPTCNFLLNSLEI